MNTRSKKALSLITTGTVVSLTALASPVFGQGADSQANAAQTGAPQPAVPAVTQTLESQANAPARVPNIQGEFAYNQGVTAGNDLLYKALYQRSDFICGAKGVDAAKKTVATNAITVTGEVQLVGAYALAELEEKYPVRKVMGCTCAANPADGRASANAEVTGFLLSGLLKDVVVAEDANTITFVSADGYEVAFPLRYVTQRYSIIVTGINGEAATDAVGISNQLWLGSTSARYFAQNIVEIRITHEQTPPPVPTAPKGANLPNVGITAGE
ncbi:MAG: molybdopterin-dependent oxidoreductase [Coriobacteriales bacterium]|jgi:DMSO/TMAO reductase YedYZ molybdopterin-dependent catalytic subunit|nr:molybdopterin-dependent oxidoreductase [Coriobacteriales bacterium]